MTKSLVGLFCALSLLAATASVADTTSPIAGSPGTGSPGWPQNQQQMQERLKTFDPVAVTAAQHYYDSPMIKNSMLSMITSLTPTIIANMAQHETKPMTEQDRAKAAKILDEAMRQNFDYLIGLNTIVALQTFSKDELVAMDNFYSSPTGQGILSKMPQLSKSMPSVLQTFMPKYLASVKADMKAEGIGVK